MKEKQLSKELVVTPNGNYTIPTLESYIEQKTAEARSNAAEHLLHQKAPNVPQIPNRKLWSRIAGILGMSDAERIRIFGTADPQTCIFTVTSQFNDHGAKVSGNKTFRKNPGKYGFQEVPLDSASIGDVLQFTKDRPHHSVLVTGRDTKGKPTSSYSNGDSTPFHIEENGDTVFTMKRNKPLDYLEENIGIPVAFRYYGSPQKQAEWASEYFKKYDINPAEYYRAVQSTIHVEQPDALRVSRQKTIQPIKEKSEGGPLNKQKKWDDLSIRERANVIRLAVQSNITDLKDIKDYYNEFAEGGDTDKTYENWKDQIAQHKRLDVENDPTYDYKSYFNKYPEEAWKMLEDSPDAHFTDEFKTVYHPTFSTESKYSGHYHPFYNPQALEGGRWNRAGNVFTMSPDGYRGPVSMDDRMNYLIDNEDNGVQLREADGSLPIYDDILHGGVLPMLTITAKKPKK